MLDNVILCKAKSKDGRGWVYGYYLRVNKEDIIYSFNEFVPIDVETLCRKVGLNDVNRKPIYENDIVLTQEYTDKPYSKNRKKHRFYAIVRHSLNHNTKYSSWEAIKYTLDKNAHKYSCRDWGSLYNCEVVGNIIDNVDDRIEFIPLHYYFKNGRFNTNNTLKE